MRVIPCTHSKKVRDGHHEHVLTKRSSLVWDIEIVPMDFYISRERQWSKGNPQKTISRGDGALSHERGTCRTPLGRHQTRNDGPTVRPRRSGLEETVPMLRRWSITVQNNHRHTYNTSRLQHRRIRQLIDNVQLEVISLRRIRKESIYIKTKWSYLVSLDENARNRCRRRRRSCDGH